MKLKKFTGLALAVALTVSTLSGGVNFNSAEVYAEENEEQTTEDITTNDGFKFTLNLQDQTAEATGYSGTNTEIVIPNTITFDGKEYKVTSIGYEAFSGCTGLSSITIPASVTEIGAYAFSGCTGLTSIDVDENNPNYSSEGGILFNKGKTELIQCPGGKKGEVTIPASVTEIGDYAFYDCTGLSSVTIPDGVTTIGGWAFEDCTGLSSITIPASVTKIGYGAFYYCTSLSSVTIPASVTEIGSCAFYYCTSLSSITIPASVTKIGDYAFYDCTSLSSITIPASVTEIGGGAFSYCDNLKNINYEGSEDSWKKLSADAGVPSSTAIHCNPAAPVITPTEKPTDPASPSAIPTPSSTPTAVTSPAPSASPAPSSPAKTAAPTSKPTPKPTASPAPQTTLAPSTQGQASLAPDVYITSASKAVKVTEDNTKATVKGKSGKLKKNAKFQINVECAGQDILSDSEYKVTCKTSKLPKKMKKYIKIKKKGKVVLKKGLKKGTYKIIVTIKDTEGNTFKRVLIVKVK
jgi:hypothetical protein